MTWLAQVWHVARKDVREEAWSLGAYLAVTALASWVLFTRAFLFSGILAYVVALLGTILVAAVVQSDSPTASDSFWGSRPFRPTAMLGAKLSLAAIVVLIPSISQGIALSVLDSSGSAAFLAMTHSSRVYVVWLLAAMVIAGLTRDVRAFVVSFAALFAAIMLAQSVWFDLHHRSAPAALQNADEQMVVVTDQLSLGGPRLWTAISICGAVALLAFLYARRDARRRMWIVGIAVMMSTAAAAFMSEPSRAQLQVRIRDTTSAPTAASIPIRVELLRSERLGQDNQMNLRVAAGGEAGSRRVLLYVDRVTIRLRDGTPVIVRGNQGSNAIVARGNPLGANIHWLHDETDFFWGFSLPLSLDQRSAISKGVTGLELDGRVSVLEPRTIGILPIEPRRWLARDGTRLQVLSVTPAPDGGTLSVESTSAVQALAPPPFDRLREYTGRQYAFVNEAHGEAIYPYSTGITSGTNAFVLPSMPLVNETATLQMKATAGTARDAAWFIGARLALVEWKQIGTRDVRIPIVELPTPPELRPHDSVTQPQHSVPAAPVRSSASKRGLTRKRQELAT